MELRYIAAIEIGSSKVSCAVATIDENKALSVIALEEEKLIDSVRYGCVKNIDDVCSSVRNVIARIENRAGISPRRLEGVYVGIGGRSVSLKSKEISEDFNEDIEITEQILSRLEASVDRTIIPDKYELLALDPREHFVDNTVSQKPLGTIGNHIKITFNLVIGKSLIKNNISRVFDERLHLPVFDYILRPTAQADVVLTDDEKRLGCVIIDFGAETTTVSIYKNGALQYLSTLPLGSRNITRDLTALNITEARAEELKLKYGSVSISDLKQYNDPIDGINSKDIHEYISARADEIIANITEQLNYAKLDPADLPSGIIIIGKGAKLRGFNTALSTQSGMQVRIGAPQPHIRIADASIQHNDAIDVISILAAASQLDFEDCLKQPEPEKTEQTELFPTGNDEPEEEYLIDEDDILDEDEDEEDEDDIYPRKPQKEPKKKTPKPEKPKKPGLFSKLRDKIAVLLTEAEDVENDNENENDNER